MIEREQLEVVLDGDELQAYAAEMINEERESPFIKTKTVLRHLSGVRRYLEALGIAAPLAKYKAPEAAEGVPHPLEGGEATIDRMVEAADGHSEKGAILALTGYMAFRISEARCIRHDQVNYEKRELLVRGKGDVWIEMPIPRKAFRLLFIACEDAKREGRETIISAADRTVRQWFTELAEEALGRPVLKDGTEGSHSARHAVGTDVYNDTKDLVLTQRTLRQRDPRTTVGYIGDKREEMRNALDNRGKKRLF